MLIGGDPGIGKSTLLLQALAHLSQAHKVIYVTGEESGQQVALRARRLNVESGSLPLIVITSYSIHYTKLYDAHQRQSLARS